MSLNRFLLSLAPFALVGCATVPSAPGAVAPVEVGIIAINDFHGALEPPRQSVFVPAPHDAERHRSDATPVPAGGAAWLASAIDSLRAKYPYHVTVSAGDLVSASQFASSLFLDEPAIGVMNRVGLDFNALGNHEFDRGRAEIKRLQTGGCEQLAANTPCQLEQFSGAQFPFLAANTITENGTPLFPATGTKTFGSGAGQVIVGFIGATLEGTAKLVSPDAVAGLRFADEADTINASVASLKAGGADAIVVLIHQGGKTSGQPDPQGCEALTGDILPILDRLDPRVDVVVSGHSHWAYICERDLPGRTSPLLLTSAGVYGMLTTDIALTIDPVTSSVIAKRARNVIVQSPAYGVTGGMVEQDARFPAFAPRADVAQYVARYTDAAKAFSDRVVGRLSAPVERPDGAASREGGTIGNLIADAQLAATQDAGAQIAFMNPFGIRKPARFDPGEGGALTFGTLYQVQPFNNQLVTQTFSGAQIKAIVEQGFNEESPLQALAPSVGLTYSYNEARPIGDRVTNLRFNGQPMNPTAVYRVTTNSFLADGGDGFSLFAQGTNRVTGGSDIAALEAFLAGPSPRSAPLERRVTDLSAKP